VIRKIIRQTVVTVISLLLLHGCSGSDEPDVKTSKSSTALNPCELLTEADAESAFPGVDMQLAGSSNPLEMNAAGQRICFWESTKDTEMVYVQLSLTDGKNTSMPMPIDKLYSSSKAMFSEVTDIEGIGSSAFHGGVGLKPGGGLTVYDSESDIMFNISMSGGKGYDPTEEDFTKQRTLAAQVVDRARSQR
jgi:hypothetical protein